MHEKSLTIVPTGSLPKIRYHEIEDLVAAVYRTGRVNILAKARVIHGDFPVYTVKPAKAAANPKEVARQLRQGSMIYLLSVLCRDGYLPQGRYILDTTPPLSVLDQYKRLLQQCGDPLAPDCIRFKSLHTADKHFRQMCQVIDHTFYEWLREKPERL